MKDPLAGYKQRLNEGGVFSLIWPDRGDGAPVQVGNVFEMRACIIRISKVHPIEKKSPWWHEGDKLSPGRYWRAEFEESRKQKRPRFLDRKGGTTSDRKQAMAAQDDPDPGTLRTFDDDERDPVAQTQHEALGKQPESEVVDPHEVVGLSLSREARQAHTFEMARARAAEEKLPLSERIRRLEECSGDDLRRNLARVEQAVQAAEAKRRRLQPQVPSDRAA